jgi:cell division protein FtsB
VSNGRDGHMGNDETRDAGRAARGGTETITRPDRMPRPRRERPAPPRPRPPADRAGGQGAPDGIAPARTRPERPAGQESRRRVPPQGFARPRGPVPDGKAERTRTAAPAAPAMLRVPRAPRPATASPASTASKAPVAPKAQQAQRPASPRTSSRMPFLLLVCGLLSGALVSALVISTTLAQGSFQISQLQQQNSVLARQRQALEAQVAQARSATAIEQRASQLGMRPVDVVRFLDLRDGKVKTDARGPANGARVRGSNR